MTIVAEAPAKRGPKKVQCENCGTLHYKIAKCANGDRLVPGRAGQGRPRKHKPEAESPQISTEEIAETAEAPVAETKTEAPAVTLITDPVEIKALAPEDLKADAEKKWKEAEAAAQAAYGPDFHLNRPAILRDKSEVAREEVLRQLGVVSAEAQQDPRSRAAALAAARVDPAVRDRQEIAAIKDGIGQMQDRQRDAKAEEARQRDIPNGSQVWMCAAGHRFNSASQEVIRNKGRAEHGWQLHCRECGSASVRMLAPKDI